MKAFFNDEILEADMIAISPDDLIVQRGVGIFDFFRIVSGKPVFIEEHLSRFIKSAELARIPLRWDKADIRRKIYKLIELNQQDHGGVKLILSGGVSPMGFEIVSPNLMIIQNLAKSPAEAQYLNGSKIITQEFARELPSVKTTNYFNSVWGYNEMKKHDAIDVLYHQNGIIHELSRSNLFIVSNGILSTPKSNILEGITRSKVIALAEKRMSVQMRDITISELYEADEVFITSTLKKVMPVIKIDEHNVGAGKPGGNTQLIMQELERLVLEFIK